MHIHFHCSTCRIYFSFQIGELLVPENIACVFAFVFVLLSLSQSLYYRLFILPQIFVRRIAVPRELGPSLALGGSHCLLCQTFFTSTTTTSALGTLMVIHLSFIFIFCFTSSHHCWYSSLSFIYLLSLSFVSSPLLHYYGAGALYIIKVIPPLPVITPLYFELIGFALS